ncbi:hypothetical protein L1278_001080 [Pontibacter sp. HSC-36F09]|nr:hypothetical protein [Pontibacter sp. HSC-36F09]
MVAKRILNTCLISAIYGKIGRIYLHIFYNVKQFQGENPLKYQMNVGI